MRLLAATILIAVTPILASAAPPVPESCPVTKPTEPPFQPPTPYPSEGGRWIGSPRLWTTVPQDGVWNGLGHYSPDDPRFRQKLLWWSEGYRWQTENPPQLVITGTRLDGLAPRFVADGASNGWTTDSEHPFMVAGIFIPTVGCWKITGQYNGEELSYVVWVSEECSSDELVSLLKQTDPAYDDATTLTSTLRSHGFVVKCVLQSKWVHLFEGQTGAALFKTDYGDFEALFLPKGQDFESLVITEGREGERFLYTLEGYPPPTSQPINSKYRMFCEKHGNVLFMTWDQAGVVKKIAKTFQ
jgi:hypothetical protein